MGQVQDAVDQEIALVGKDLDALAALLVPSTPVPPDTVLAAMLPAVSQSIQVLHDLHVPASRPLSVFLNPASPQVWKSQADNLVSAGFKLSLSIRTDGSEKAPSTPVVDFGTFETQLRTALEPYASHCVVAAFGNEPNQWYYSGTAQQYLDELTHFQTVARGMGLTTADGGLSYGGIVTGYILDNGTSDPTGTLSFCQQTMLPEARFPFATPQSLVDLANLVTKLQANADVMRGKGMLDGMVSIPTKYQNMHWYDGAATAFAQAVGWLRSKSGKNVVCNEMGIRTDTPNTVTALVQQVLTLLLPHACWYSISNPGDTARTLMDPTGALNDLGKAFLLGLGL